MVEMAWNALSPQGKDEPLIAPRQAALAGAAGTTLTVGPPMTEYAPVAPLKAGFTYEVVFSEAGFKDTMGKKKIRVEGKVTSKR